MHNKIINVKNDKGMNGTLQCLSLPDGYVLGFPS